MSMADNVRNTVPVAVLGSFSIDENSIFPKVEKNYYLSTNISPSQDGITPLFMASQNGHTDIVNILLANGADVNIKGFKV